MRTSAASKRRVSISSCRTSGSTPISSPLRARRTKGSRSWKCGPSRYSRKFARRGTWTWETGRLCGQFLDDQPKAGRGKVRTRGRGAAPDSTEESDSAAGEGTPTLQGQGTVVETGRRKGRGAATTRRSGHCIRGWHSWASVSGKGLGHQRRRQPPGGCRPKRARPRETARVRRAEAPRH